LLPATVGDTDAKVMSSLLVIGPAKGNRIIQILSAINYRFSGAEFSLDALSSSDNKLMTT
jgi:hypothetical protein